MVRSKIGIGTEVKVSIRIEVKYESEMESLNLSYIKGSRRSSFGQLQNSVRLKQTKSNLLLKRSGNSEPRPTETKLG